MAALDTIAPKLSKLIPRLGSNHDGELVATVRAIRRTLEGAGLDLHALAEAIGEPTIIYRPPPRPADPPRPHQMHARRCLQSGIAWKAHETQFLHEMASQLRRPTEKQRDWLDGLLDRAARHNRKTK